jgi:predicted transcriptional regulator
VQESKLRIVTKLMDRLRKASHLCARDAVVQHDALESWQDARLAAFKHHRPEPPAHVADLELAQVDESGEEAAKELDAGLKPAMPVPVYLDCQANAGKFGTAYDGVV